ncbi:MAG: deoxyribonuclease [Gammaproteobacteria bacterium]|nr:deoxyribonuclease [Gammaproteobacteria bacterium]
MGYYSWQSPEQEIELDAPLSEAGDPAIHNRIEASKPSASQVSIEKTAKTRATASTTDANDAQDTTAAPVAATADIAALRAEAVTDIVAGESARSLISAIRLGEQDLSMDQLFERAAEHRHQTSNTDAYLLYFFAARRGHGPSALQLAKMHDPAFFEPGSDLLEKPDPVQAHKWYTIAVDRDVEGAVENLQVLRNSIEAAAQAGDLSAQRLLLNWK